MSVTLAHGRPLSFVTKRPNNKAWKPTDYSVLFSYLSKRHFNFFFLFLFAFSMYYSLYVCLSRQTGPVTEFVFVVTLEMPPNHTFNCPIHYTHTHTYIHCLDSLLYLIFFCCKFLLLFACFVHHWSSAIDTSSEFFAWTLFRSYSITSRSLIQSNSLFKLVCKVVFNVFRLKTDNFNS